MVSPGPEGSWRYEGSGRSRWGQVAGILISVLLHLALFFGDRLLPESVEVAKAMEEAPVIRLTIPEAKLLEEPELVAEGDGTEPLDLALPVPMQSDLPQIPRPSDFVQRLNFASLLEAPDLSQSNISIIPEQYTRAVRIAERIGKIFNLEDLDRPPAPILQPAPTYPFALRREGINAMVVVDFIVDVEGRVLETVVFDSSHTGFNDAAVAGVARWKFRPGYKDGRKVNVRMRVPIIFKIVDSDS